MTPEKLELIRCHYNPPFSYDPQGQHIRDRDERLVLDVRGWGWIHKLHNSEVIQDGFGEFVAELLNRELGQSAAPKKTK